MAPEEWTRLLFGDVELSNCIQYSEWKSDPAMPWVCETCREAGCGKYRLAHIVRTETQLLWMRPYASSLELLAFKDIHPSQMIEDAVLVEQSEWDRVGRDELMLPEFECFPRATNHDTIQLWLQQRPSYALPSEYETFIGHLRNHVIASHPLSIEQAFQQIEFYLDQLSSEPKFQPGSIQEIEVDPEIDNTLYFDDDSTLEFRAFSIGVDCRLIIAGRYAFSRIDRRV